MKEYNSTISDDFKEQNIKYTLSKREDDLFREENNIAGKVLRVKWIKLPRNGNRWKIVDEHNKVLFVVEGNKFGKKEQAFLQTVNGFTFLIQQFKSGVKSVNGLKLALRSTLKKNKELQKRA